MILLHTDLAPSIIDREGMISYEVISYSFALSPIMSKIASTMIGMSVIK
jgi:hypothetical protein